MQLCNVEFCTNEISGWVGLPSDTPINSSQAIKKSLLSFIAPGDDVRA